VALAAAHLKTSVRSEFVMLLLLLCLPWDVSRA
jgi:hypothetical protein